MTTENTTDTEPVAKQIKDPTFVYSLLAVMVVAGVLLVGSLTTNAPVELLMLIAVLLLFPVVMRLGHSFAQCEHMVFDAIRPIMELLFILIAVGALIGTWGMSGTIPAIIHMGLAIISPTWFLMTALFLCSIVALVTGTTWGTYGSVGVALMAVAASLDVHPALAAGVIISGAAFGDKLCPLSDSTVLNASLTGTPLMVHIRYMLWTTGPAYILTIGVILAITFMTSHSGGAGNAQIADIQAALEATYKMGLPTMIPPIVTITALVMQVSPFVSILSGAITGSIVAVLYQGVSIDDALTVLHSGYVADTGAEQVDGLISGGGMVSMGPLVFLFMFAVGASGLLAASGMLGTLLRPLLDWATTRRRVMLATPWMMLTGIGVGASYSFGAVMVAASFKDTYRDLDLRSENLSRIMEDSGTVWDPFFPWSGGAIFAAATLGVSTLAYMPFLFFAYFCLIMSLIVSATQFKVRRISVAGDHPAAL